MTNGQKCCFDILECYGTLEQCSGSVPFGNLCSNCSRVLRRSVLIGLSLVLFFQSAMEETVIWEQHTVTLQRVSELNHTHTHTHARRHARTHARIVMHIQTFSASRSLLHSLPLLAITSFFSIPCFYLLILSISSDILFIFFTFSSFFPFQSLISSSLFSPPMFPFDSSNLCLSLSLSLSLFSSSPFPFLSAFLFLFLCSPLLTPSLCLSFFLPIYSLIPLSPLSPSLSLSLYWVLGITAAGCVFVKHTIAYTHRWQETVKEKSAKQHPHPVCVCMHLCMCVCT